ncbi:MAG TPA: aminotransferase class IV, partial [Acidobacteriota bacterium]|nr:aminotransferase class IV [Acidobacteriota bacterium]
RGIGKIHLDIDLSRKASYVIIVLPYEPPPARYYEEGVKVAFVSIRRNDPTALNPKIKASNLLNNVMAYIQAKEQQAYEGLFCNLSGHITECTSSNFFIVKRGTLITPAPGAGLLEGVVRGLTLELAAANSIPVKEMDMVPQDCLDANESFITSSLKGIMPVRRLGDQSFSPIPGPITKLLTDAYRQYIKAGKT